jgi:hypothetical protein
MRGDEKRFAIVAGERRFALALPRKCSYSVFMSTFSRPAVQLILRSGALLDLLLLRPART